MRFHLLYPVGLLLTPVAPFVEMSLIYFNREQGLSILLSPQAIPFHLISACCAFGGFFAGRAALRSVSGSHRS